MLRCRAQTDHRCTDGIADLAVVGKAHRCAQSLGDSRKKEAGGGADADDRDLDGKLDAENRMVFAAVDKSGKRVLPGALDDIIDDHIFDQLFGALQHEVSKINSAEAKGPAENLGPGKSRLFVTKINLTEDMQGIGRGEATFEDPLSACQVFELHVKGDAAEAGALPDGRRGCPAGFTKYGGKVAIRNQVHCLGAKNDEP